MTEKRVKVRLSAIDGVDSALLLISVLAPPDTEPVGDVELVWQEPDNFPPHQCEGLRSGNAQIQHLKYPEEWALQCDIDNEGFRYICEVIRCPCCDEWVAPAKDE